MEKVMVNFRMDKDLKTTFETYCEDIGMSLGTAFTIFAKKVTKEGKIPFDLDVEPFYSQKNMKRIAESIKKVETGVSKLTAHELIEVEND